MGDGGEIAQKTCFAPDRIAILLAAGLGILACVMLWHVGELLTHLKAVLFYPYSLDYGEGIVWQQMRDMVDGTAYGPLQVYPAIVYHYPPVFHMTSAALAALTGMDQLVAGRLVSILSSFATAYMVGLLTARAMPAEVDGRVRAICATMAGLLFLTCYPVLIWTPLMRVDMLSGALGLAGMLLALRALDRPAWIYGAAAMFVLSLYAKQISIAAPMAAFSVLLLVRPGLAVRGIAFSTISGLLALAWLSRATDGGFLTHILVYNINRFLPSSFGDILFPQLFIHMVLIALSVLGVTATWRGSRTFLDKGSLALIRDSLAQNRAAVAALMLLIFLGLKTIMLLGILKSGASYNYMIEWFSAVAVFAALTLAPFAARAMGQTSGVEKLSPVHVVLALVALPLQLAFLPVGFSSAQAIAQNTKVGARIVERIASSTRPVISDDMTLLIRAGRNVEWESAITAELAQLGKYDQLGFARLVRAHCFGLLVTEGKVDRLPFRARYNPPVAAAILSAYPLEEKISKYSLRWPSAAPASNGHCPLR
ncbi:hypothetical protein [Sphingobium aromaticiconvertens]|uniref:hypothetical protein n=1 Tax=Sphingobium aromaticiconvertens TaxID=365341 RepID=UPI00301A15A2